MQNNTAITSALEPQYSPSVESLKQRRAAPDVPPKPRALLRAATDDVTEPVVRPTNPTPTPSATAAALTPPAASRPATPVKAASIKAPSIKAPSIEADGKAAQADATTPAATSSNKLRAFGRAFHKYAMVVRDWSREPISWEAASRPFRALWSVTQPLGPKLKQQWQNPSVRSAVYGTVATALCVTAIVGICIGTGGILALPALALGIGIGFGFASFRAFLTGRDAAASNDAP